MSESSLSRRVIRRKVDRTQKLIVFCLRQQWFAIPIEFAYKLIQQAQIYGQFDETGIGFTLYQGRELRVIDIERRIFSFSQPLLPDRINRSLVNSTQAKTTDSSDLFKPYLLILQNAQNELVGISIKTQLTLRRVIQSAFVPVPATYLVEGNTPYICAFVIIDSTEPPLFLLNLNQLMRS